MKPFISVIVPCFNEIEFLGGCLDSILASDYPADRMEVLVADGRSTDGTRELIGSYSARDPRVRLVDNPDRVTPAALNRGIAEARGEIVARVDAHAKIAEDYLSRAVDHLAATGAANVGGPMRTIARDAGPFAEAIQIVLSHPLGVGNSRFRTARAVTEWVDTVFGGCWPREVLDQVGPFNENLVRSQDLEFNLRTARAGGGILLASDVHSDYYARAAFWAFLRHNWSNGVWAILPFRYSDAMPVRWRHLVPLAFTGSLVSLAVLALAAPPAGWLLLAVVAKYTAMVGTASCVTAVRKRRPGLLLTLPVSFAGLHFAYGAGSLWGLLRVAGAKCLGSDGRRWWHIRHGKESL